MLAYAFGEIVLLLLGRDVPALRLAFMFAYRPRFAIANSLLLSLLFLTIR